MIRFTIKVIKFSSKNQIGKFKKTTISIVSNNFFIGLMKLLSLKCLTRFKIIEAETKTNEKDEIIIPS